MNTPGIGLQVGFLSIVRGWLACGRTRETPSGRTNQPGPFIGTQILREPCMERNDK